MSQINLQVDVNDINTVLQGLGFIQENSARVANIVRTQAQAQLEAEQAAQEAAKADAASEPTAGTVRDAA